MCSSANLPGELGRPSKDGLPDLWPQQSPYTGSPGYTLDLLVPQALPETEVSGRRYRILAHAAVGSGPDPALAYGIRLLSSTDMEGQLAILDTRRSLRESLRKAEENISQQYVHTQPRPQGEDRGRRGITRRRLG